MNANVPVSIGGGSKGKDHGKMEDGRKKDGGDSSAKQELDNDADSEASNEAKTDQDADQTQDSSSDCKYGCGGSGQSQKLEQDADTNQKAESEANAKQDAVNVNLPISIKKGHKGRKDKRYGDSARKGWR